MSSVASVRRLYDAVPVLVVPHMVSPLQVVDILQTDGMSKLVHQDPFEVVRHAGLLAAQRELYPEVPVHEVPGAAVDQHLPDPAHVVEDAGQGALLRGWMDAPVLRVGEQLVGSLVARAHDPIAPGGRGRSDRHRRPPMAARGASWGSLGRPALRKNGKTLPLV